MPSVALRITLHGDAAFTADSATSGGATTLNYVPGATLYGAAAAALAPGRGLSRQDFFNAFLLGAVRFSDGLPEHNGEVGLPTPLCLHVPKEGTDAAKDLGNDAFNLARVARPAKAQLAQVRGKFVTSGGVRFEPPTTYSLRTAVDPSGRARDRHLYGLHAIQAGATFRARITSDDAALLERVIEALVGRVRLGRSRTAELGAAKVQVVEDNPVPVETGSSGELVLLCLSDLALRDPRTGAPTLWPTPEALGLPEGFTVVPGRTFLRTRRYTPFNGHRRKPDLERQVVVAGSVITVAGPSVDRDEVRQRFAAGVGLYTHQGLGQILVEPTFLRSPRIQLREASGSPAEAVPLPQDALGRWLSDAVANQKAQQRALEFVQKSVDQLARFGIPRSQWGEVRERARAARRKGASAEALIQELEEHVMEGQTRVIWEKRRGGTRAVDALTQALHKARKLDESPIAFSRTVELLASRVARKQAQEGR